MKIFFKVFNTMRMQESGNRLSWDKRNPVFGRKNNRIATQHEYIVCYSKGNVKLYARSLNRAADSEKRHLQIDKKVWRTNTRGVARENLKTWINNKPEFKWWRTCLIQK